MLDRTLLAAQYREAFYGGNHAALSELLADDFMFEGPVATYHGRDTYLKASAHVQGKVRLVEVQRVFSDGDDVCAIFSVAVEHPVQRFPIVEWYRFAHSRIASIRTFFDTGPFVRQPGETDRTAVDPVCHMSVDKAAPAATRRHGGRTWYFCSEGCAIAFDAAPDSVLDGKPKHD